MEFIPENPDTEQKMEPIKVLNGQQLKTLIKAGLLWLRTNQQIVNSLNVFPVPDGDTGSNMVLTMQSGWNEVIDYQGNDVDELMSHMARGALMGARGNSGVILSQFWRGFSRALEKQPVITMELFSKALTEAKRTAYKGVVRPVEGTILTVLKDTADKVSESLDTCTNFVQLLTISVEAAEKSVEHTPELLPVLKQAGVVDSGGKGLFFILEGFLRSMENKPLDTNPDVVEVVPISMMTEEESIEPGQDYEVVVDFIPEKELDLSIFYDRLLEIGTSVQVGEGDGNYRLHIHVPSENLFAPVNYILTLGVVTNVAIENLVAQMDAIRRKKQTQYELTPIEEGQIGVVAVSPGDGISRIFASLGVAQIIRGGQTMNPSTEEILNAIESLPTDRVIVLPNNKNVILAANNTITQTTKHVVVIRSKNVPQGISAMLRLVPDGDFDQIVEEMNESLTAIQTGEITRATRTVELNGVQVTEGQYIVMHNGDLELSSDSLETALFEFLENVKVTDYEWVTIFYGQDVKESDMLQIVGEIHEKYPDLEVESHYGGQPHYFFIFSIE